MYYAPDITKMTIAGNDISQYGIVVPPSGTVFYDAEVSALVRAILLNCGYEAEVYTSDSENLPQKAIYIGTTATEEINTDNDKAITFEKDGNLYICSKEKESVSSGVYTLTKMIEESKDKLEIISGYENVYGKTRPIVMHTVLYGRTSLTEKNWIAIIGCRVSQGWKHIITEICITLRTRKTSRFRRVNFC